MFSSTSAPEQSQAIEAMGGELVITARFPNADVRLNGVAMEQKQSGHSIENGL